MSLINLRKFLDKYRLQNGYYPDLDVLKQEMKIKKVDFVYHNTLHKYVLSYNLDLDDDGQADDYLYINSSGNNVKEIIDGSRPILPDK